MPRDRKTDYALLGLLSIQPMSGYDMKAFIAQTIGFFWQESYGQIYPTLKRLRAEKLVTRRVTENEGRPDRHVYSITAEGRRRLREWMSAETEPERLRHELLLKLFFGPEVAPEVHKQQIEALLKHQLGRLEQFKEVEKGTLNEYRGSAAFPYWHATLRFGVLVTQARVKWCRETLAKIDRMAKESGE